MAVDTFCLRHQQFFFFFFNDISSFDGSVISASIHLELLVLDFKLGGVLLEKVSPPPLAWPLLLEENHSPCCWWIQDSSAPPTGCGNGSLGSTSRTSSVLLCDTVAGGDPGRWRSNSPGAMRCVGWDSHPSVDGQVAQFGRDFGKASLLDGLHSLDRIGVGGGAGKIDTCAGDGWSSKLFQGEKIERLWQIVTMRPAGTPESEGTHPFMEVFLERASCRLLWTQMWKRTSVGLKLSFR